MKDDDLLDLHESEWRSTGHREPLFGHAAKPFLIYTVVGLIVFWPVKWIVTSLFAG